MEERSVTRRNFLAGSAAAAALAGLAGCSAGTAGGDAGTSAAASLPSADKYPIDPDGSDVQAKWTSEETRDGWTRYTNPDGGAELGVMDTSKVIQVDGLAFKDMNGNGKLDLYEDWRQSGADRAAALAEQLSAEEILPLMFHNGMMSATAPLDDDSAEKLGAKIREASFWKVPYKIVVGPRDEAAGTVSVRKSGEGDLGAMSLDDLLKRLAAEAQP